MIICMMMCIMNCSTQEDMLWLCMCHARSSVAHKYTQQWVTGLQGHLRQICSHQDCLRCLKNDLHPCLRMSRDLVARLWGGRRQREREIPGGTKRATSVSMPLLRLQSSEGKSATSREIEPVRGSLRRVRKSHVHGSGKFGAFWTEGEEDTKHRGLNVVHGRRLAGVLPNDSRGGLGWEVVYYSMLYKRCT